MDGCQDRSTSRDESHQSQDASCFDPSLQMDEDLVGSGSISGTMREADNTEDKVRNERPDEHPGAMYGSSENAPNQPPTPELPTENQRSSINQEAQDQPGRGSGDGGNTNNNTRSSDGSDGRQDDGQLNTAQNGLECPCCCTGIRNCSGVIDAICRCISLCIGSWNQ